MNPHPAPGGGEKTPTAEKVDLTFMVVPSELDEKAFVRDPVRIRIVDAEGIFLTGILGESGRKLVLKGVDFYFTKPLAERLIEKGIAVEVPDRLTACASLQAENERLKYELQNSGEAFAAANESVHSHQRRLEVAGKIISKMRRKDGGNDPSDYHYATLIAKLRNLGDVFEQVGHVERHEICEMAALALEKNECDLMQIRLMEGRLAAAERELARCKEAHNILGADNSARFQENEQLKRELAELRGTIREARNLIYVGGKKCGPYPEEVFKADAILGNALSAAAPAAPKP